MAIGQQNVVRQFATLSADVAVSRPHNRLAGPAVMLLARLRRPLAARAGPQEVLRPSPPRDKTPRP